MGDIVPKNFFEESREFAKKSNGYRNALNDEAEKLYLNERGNIIGVIGQAGVGKTTFSKILLRDVLDEKKKLYHADYIFYVRLRDFQNKKKIKLLDFLFKNITSDLGKTIDSFKNFISHLSDSDSVVILLDGFDEIDFDEKLNDQSNLTFDMYSEKSPQYFISGLLSGKILPKAKKIITSRPTQMLDLRPSLRPIFIVSIIGIDEKGQQQICEDICKNDEQMMKLVWNYVQNQPELNSYCYVPIMAILIFHTIYQIFKFHKSDQHTPKGITQILVYNFCLFIDTDHIHKNDSTKIKLEPLSKLSKLAYKGIIKKQFYFSDEDFQAAELDKDDINTFFTTFHTNDSLIAIVKKVTKKLSYFSHLIWQEFFAAIYMIFHLEPKDLKKACSDFKLFALYSPFDIDLSSSRFEVVTKFLFGLCCERTIEILKSIDNSYFSSPIHHASVLKQYLHSHIKNINSFLDIKPIFCLASWLYEIKDKNLTQECSNLLRSVLVVSGDVFPNDILPFCDLIGERQLDLELHLINPRFYKNSHLLFFKEMEPIIVKQLYIKVNIYFTLLCFY